MKKIYLSKGYAALVDDADYDTLSQFTWTLVRSEGRYYASRHISSVEDRTERTRVYMHQQILGWFKGVDHKDGNGLNNQRLNLRHCTTSQNGGNRKKQAGVSSKYKGVSWNSSKEKWHAQIWSQGKVRHLGWFKEEEAAALAYNAAAVEVFKEFALVNEVSA